MAQKEYRRKNMANNLNWDATDTINCVIGGTALAVAVTGVIVGASAKRDVKRLGADVADLQAWQNACIATGNVAGYQNGCLNTGNTI
jgi:hypothetical protein